MGNHKLGMYWETILLPNYVAQIIKNINYRKDVRSRVLSFLKKMMVDSRRVNDDNYIFNYVQRDSKYLKKSLGGNYNKVVTPLLDNNIINRDYYISKHNNLLDVKTKSYDYRILPYINHESYDFNYIINNLLDVNNNNDYIDILTSSLYKGDTLFYKALSTLGYEGVLYKKNNIIKSKNKYIKTYVNIVSNLDIDFYTLTVESLLNCRTINITQFTLNKDINLDVVKVKDIVGNTYVLKLEKALEVAKISDKDLIYDKVKNVCYIETINNFIIRKRKDKLLGDLSTIFELIVKNYRASRNETNNRLDTNITNMSGYLLKIIKDKNDLVEIDLRNSQFVISLLLLNQLDTDDYLLYHKLSVSGELYEYIQNVFSLETREEAKNICFEVMFGNYKTVNQNTLRFKELFPSVLEWINKYKRENGYKSYSIKLQQEESKIFIDGLYEELLNVGIDSLTKHDSVIIKRSDLEKTLDVINNHFDKLGLKVTLRY